MGGTSMTEGVNGWYRYDGEGTSGWSIHVAYCCDLGHELRDDTVGSDMYVCTIPQQQAHRLPLSWDSSHLLQSNSGG